MVMVTRLRTENTIATTKKTNDVVHRETRVTVPLYNCICIKYVVHRDTRVTVPLYNCICIKYMS
jgi:hypothetical protein